MLPKKEQVAQRAFPGGCVKVSGCAFFREENPGPLRREQKKSRIVSGLLFFSRDTLKNGDCALFLGCVFSDYVIV